MKICNLVVAHKNPDQLSRLLSNLSHSSCTTYLHIDKKFDIKPFKDAVGHMENVFFLKKRIRIHWGSPSLVNAVAHSLMEIKASGSPYDFINFISAQDFPIKPIGEFVDFLSANRDKQFISYMEGAEAAQWWQSAAQRFQNYHFNGLEMKYKYLAQDLANKMLPRRKAPEGWNLVGGNCATWWTLQAECAYFLAEAVTNEKKVRDFIKLTWGIDEIIFPTLVMNSPFKDTAVNNNLRYIDWRENNAHPQILGCEDLNKILQTPDFFARKFDTAVDATVLDLIEQHILKPAR